MILERPKIADLAFRLYDRPVHPELFDPVAARALRIGGATLVARLTATGCCTPSPASAAAASS